jgi:triphosphoribosyl-dephospho-CoA synthase
VQTFLTLLATEPDTFIIKKHGRDVAMEIMRKAQEVLDGTRPVEALDEECIAADINPGSIADITIAAIFVALGEGWEWDS